MKDYKIIGIDLAKKKLHIVALDNEHKVVLKKAISYKDFVRDISHLFEDSQTFAFEACGGSHYIGQLLKSVGHKVIALGQKM